MRAKSLPGRLQAEGSGFMLTSVTVNRVPVLIIWAAIAAERLCFACDETPDTWPGPIVNRGNRRLVCTGLL